MSCNLVAGGGPHLNTEENTISAKCSKAELNKTRYVCTSKGLENFETVWQARHLSTRKKKCIYIQRSLHKYS